MARLIDNNLEFRDYQHTDEHGRTETVRVPIVTIDGEFDTNDPDVTVEAFFQIEDLTSVSIHGQHLAHGGSAVARIYHLMDPCIPTRPCLPETEANMLKTMDMMAQDFVRFYNALRAWYPSHNDLTPLPELHNASIVDWVSTVQNGLQDLQKLMRSRLNSLDCSAPCCLKPCYSMFVSLYLSDVPDQDKQNKASGVGLAGQTHCCCT